MNEGGHAALVVSSRFDVNLEGLTHGALDVTAFQAASPTQDEGAPFVGVGHDLSPKTRVATTFLLDKALRVTYSFAMQVEGFANTILDAMQEASGELLRLVTQPPGSGWFALQRIPVRT